MASQYATIGFLVTEPKYSIPIRLTVGLQLAHKSRHPLPES